MKTNGKIQNYSNLCACSLRALIKCRYVKTDKFVNVGHVPLKFLLPVYSLSIAENSVKDPRVEYAVGVCKKGWVYCFLKLEKKK